MRSEWEIQKDMMKELLLSLAWDSHRYDNVEKSWVDEILNFVRARKISFWGWNCKFSSIGKFVFSNSSRFSLKFKFLRKITQWKMKLLESHTSTVSNNKIKFANDFPRKIHFGDKITVFQCRMPKQQYTLLLYSWLTPFSQW